MIGLSRFLIRPSVRCRDLASKALSLALRQLPEHRQRRYLYRPLLAEPFVAQDPHAGTSLAAAAQPGGTRIPLPVARRPAPGRPQILGCAPALPIPARLTSGILQARRLLCQLWGSARSGILLQRAA
jgi:hypothetical protein